MLEINLIIHDKEPRGLLIKLPVAGDPESTYLSTPFPHSCGLVIPFAIIAQGRRGRNSSWEEPGEEDESSCNWDRKFREQVIFLVYLARIHKNVQLVVLQVVGQWEYLATVLLCPVCANMWALPPLCT